MITTNQKSTVNKQKMTRKKYISKESQQGFPDGSVVKNLPANEGDMGLISGPVRTHVLQNNQAHEPALLGLCCRAGEPQLLKPAHPRACALW